VLCGDVPWEGSSRRSVSLQAPCHVKFYVRPRGQGAAQLLERDKGLSRCAFRFSSATWQTESGRSRTRAAGAPHGGGSSRSGLGVGGARAPDKSSVENS
jgi:hypothetical protein